MADYDGDGKSDAAVFVTAFGIVESASNTFDFISFGLRPTFRSAI